jgi:hypothetical protein
MYQLRVANQSVDKQLMTLLLLHYEATMHTLNAQSALVFNDAFGILSYSSEHTYEKAFDLEFA